MAERALPGKGFPHFATKEAAFDMSDQPFEHTLCKRRSVGYLAAMSTVAEIKTAFKRLPEREQWKLAEWIQETLESWKTLDAQGAKGREPVSAVVSIVRKVKRERREAHRRS